MILDIPGPVEYVDQWITPYDKRLRQLTARQRRIAYFYELPDTSTFRYRTLNPGFSLDADPGRNISSSWFDHRDLRHDDAFLREADALVICRTRYNGAVARMVAIARAMSVPVLFDCDDFVFDLAYLHILTDALDKAHHQENEWDFWTAVIGRISMTMKLCDGLITTNDFLAEKARQLNPSLHTAVMPNYLNPEQQALSERLYHAKKDSGWRRDNRIHIGYFSGSPSHSRDFAVVAPALCRLMDRDPRIVLRIVGFLKPESELMRHKDRIEIFPLQDFLNLQRLIAEVEINIAPLQDSTFTNCKSELKFFEAAICGTITLASPTFAFRASMEHGRTGLLVPAYEWDEALEEAVALVDDGARYHDMATAAFNVAKARYGWDRQSATIEKAVFGLLDSNHVVGGVCPLPA